MMHIYPEYYQNFKCIANRCADSCCKDWDIDVDSETERFYNTVSGELGDKIRRLTVTDSYGERVFISNNGRCPFWNRDMLCDIYIGLGEEHMSETCRNFPRLTLEFDGFTEHLLSFACPEAARFMLLSSETAYSGFGGDTELELAENEGGFLSFLLKARSRSVEMLLDRSLPFAYRLADCIEFNTQVQGLLNGEEPRALELNEIGEFSCRSLFDMHLGFEIMSGLWRQRLEIGADDCDTLPISDDFDADFEKMALYFIYRYYLAGGENGNVLDSLRRIACAYIITGKTDAALAAKGEEFDRLRLLQRYSKEVEHSYDNDEKLNTAFAADSKFSPESLIVMLNSNC